VVVAVSGLAVVLVVVVVVVVADRQFVLA
jgi:hypothetical protein